MRPHVAREGALYLCFKVFGRENELLGAERAFLLLYKVGLKMGGDKRFLQESYEASSRRASSTVSLARLRCRGRPQQARFVSGTSTPAVETSTTRQRAVEGLYSDNMLPPESEQTPPSCGWNLEEEKKRGAGQEMAEASSVERLERRQQKGEGRPYVLVLGVVAEALGVLAAESHVLGVLPALGHAGRGLGGAGGDSAGGDAGADGEH
ncbi:hypothetical protein FH972_024161 [Carpinus fangiana]|uniref:Uncharacterized protein n=1 Tax=Carpinus fangiana TaxID=176857 RepID=A0A5N6KXX6_9ROSI|nr:hypothetical protein FH972_024161 [Carpinus fangiana]